MTATRAARWLPVVFWAGLIFTFSSIPALGTGLGTWDLVLRKLAHFTEYAIFGWLIMRALRDTRGWQLHHALMAVALAGTYAVSDELHQVFVPGRTAAFGDVVIDTLGAATAQVLIAIGWFRRRR